MVGINYMLPKMPAHWWKMILGLNPGQGHICWSVEEAVPFLDSGYLHLYPWIFTDPFFLAMVSGS